MKTRQRGDIVLDLIIGIGGVAIIGVVYAWGNSALKHHYVDPERIEWNREKATLVGNVKSAEADVKTCSVANDSLKSQFDTFISIHNKQVEDAVVLDKLQRGNRAAAEKVNAPKLADLAMEQFNLIIQLGKPDGGITCDQSDSMLLETAKRRAKFYGEVPTAAAPAAGVLRLTEPAPERPKVTNPLRAK